MQKVKYIVVIILILLLVLFAFIFWDNLQEVKLLDNIYEYSVTTIEGKEVSLSAYKGKVLLIVNVASKCGFTKQYEGLEKIYKQFKDRGFEILAFPCNQFGNQEPGTEEEIKNFCSLNFKVSFPLFKKIDVNGENTHPFYQYLKAKKAGILGTESIKWNFTKFLINKNGDVLERYASQTTPEELIDTIEKLLTEKSN